MKNPASIMNHLGIYGLIQDEAKQKILAIKKSRGPYQGKLDLPGGRPEGCENFVETLTRELDEETGLKLLQASQLITLLHIQDYQDTVFRHTAIIYHCQAIGDIKLTPDGHDSLGCVWICKTKLEPSTCSPLIMGIVDIT